MRWSRASAQSDGVLFVVDQDLRAPEVAAIKRFLATGKPLYLVLNKADQFTAGDRDAILLSIRAKMPAGFPAAHVVCRRRRADAGRTRDRGCARRRAGRIAPAVERCRGAGEFARAASSRRAPERALRFESALIAGEARRMQDQSILPDTIEALRKLSADARLRPQERASIEKEMQRYRGVHRQARERPRRDRGVRRGRLGQERAPQCAGGRKDLRGVRRARLDRQSFQSRLQEHQARSWSTRRASTKRPANCAASSPRKRCATPISCCSSPTAISTGSRSMRSSSFAICTSRCCWSSTKPICYGPAQIKEISESILRKVGHRIGAADIVFAAAAPRETEREIHKADGTIEIVRYQPKPKIEHAGRAHAGSPRSRGQGDHRAQRQPVCDRRQRADQALKQQVRGKEVTRLIYYFMLGKALGGRRQSGAGVRRARRHGERRADGAAHRRDLRHRFFAEERARHGAGDPARLGADGGGRIRLACRRRPACAPSRSGTSTVLTAVPQGLAAAWSTYVVGNAANVYFRDAGWGGRSPKDIVQDILTGAETQKTSILAPIRDQLKAKFGR